MSTALQTSIGTVVWIADGRLNVQDTTGAKYVIGIEGESIKSIVNSATNNLVYYVSKDAVTGSWRAGILNLTSGEHNSFNPGLGDSVGVSSLSATPNNQLIINTDRPSSPVATYDMSTGKEISNEDAANIKGFFTANKKGEIIDFNSGEYRVKSLHYSADGSYFLVGSNSTGERLFATTFDKQGNRGYTAITENLKAGRLKSVLAASASNCLFTLDGNSFQNLYEYNVNGALNKSKNEYQLYNKVEFGNELYRQSGGIDANKQTSFYGYDIQSVNPDGTLTYLNSKGKESRPFNLQIGKALQIPPGSWLEGKHPIDTKIVAEDGITIEIDTFPDEVIFTSFNGKGHEADRLAVRSTPNGDTAFATLNNTKHPLRSFVTPEGEIGLSCIAVSDEGQLVIIYDDVIPKEFIQEDSRPTPVAFRALSSRIALDRNGSSTEIRLNSNIYKITDNDLLRLITTDETSSTIGNYAGSSSNAQKLYSFPSYQTQDEYNRLGGFFDDKR